MTRAARTLRIAVLLNPSAAATRPVFDGILDVAAGRNWQFTGDADAAIDGLISDHGVWDAPVPAVTLCTDLCDDADVRPDATRVHAMALEHFRERGFAGITVDPSDATALPPRTGCFVTDDVRAATLVHDLLAAGRSVPEDVAVLGLGDDRLACGFGPVTLSSVDLAPRTLGRRAAMRLDRLIHGKPVPAVDLVPPAGVIPRSSTDTLAIADDDVRTAVAFIRDHAGGPLRVGDVVRAVGVDRRTLERRFGHHLGRSPLDVIRRQRLRRAADLLRDGRRSVGEVAAACGFRLPQHLSAAFRRAYGQTPGDFRASVIA